MCSHYTEAEEELTSSEISLRIEGLSSCFLKRVPTITHSLESSSISNNLFKGTFPAIVKDQITILILQ